MKQRDQKKRRKVVNKASSQNDRSNLLDVLLALDRTVVETSMRKYEVPDCDRAEIRAQQRCLHNAIRELQLRLKHLPAAGGKTSHDAAAA